MIGFAQCWRACAQQAPLLSDDPWNQWPGLQSPRWFSSFHLSDGAEWAHEHDGGTPGRACCMPPINTSKRYTIPFEEYMIANALVSLQSRGAACEGLFPWKPYSPPVRNELCTLEACRATDGKRQGRGRWGGRGRGIGGGEGGTEKPF